MKLSLACWDYDRTRPLLSGLVKPEGIDLQCVNIHYDEIFQKMMLGLEFDAAELSLSMYVSSLFLKDRQFIALPVFLSRFFPHSTVYVNKESHINTPKELRGKRVGIHSYQFTAGVWIRGILAEHYDVPLESATYVIGGLANPKEVHIQLPFDAPRGVKLERLENGSTLALALERGDIDAVYSPSPPRSYKTTASNILRLVENHMEIEEEYFNKTRIFPMMHVLALKRSVYEENPWIAKSLFRTFLKSKQMAYDELYQRRTVDPWGASHADHLVELMGSDFWPYGLKPNEGALDKFLQYHSEQGLSKYKIEPRDLFVPESVLD